MKYTPLALLIPFLPTSLQLRPYPTTITPIGPFTIPRSTSSSSTSPLSKSATSTYDTLASDGDNFIVELMRIDVESKTTGEMPSKERVLKIAEKMNKSRDEYNEVISELKSSSDFQCREYYALTVANAKRNGYTLDDVDDVVKWQVRYSFFAYHK